MLTVVIRHDGEDSVVKFTYESLWRELKDIEGAQIRVAKDWFKVLDEIKTPFVCFVESDCLVNSGYFTSLVNLLKKQSQERGIAVMASAVAVEVWVNKFYGYKLESEGGKGIGLMPVKEVRSNGPYMAQMVYIPGAVIRLGMLQRLIADSHLRSSLTKDLVKMSSVLSLGFWNQGVSNSIGNKVFINPNSTYVTTEKYVNDIPKFNIATEFKDISKVTKMFRQHLI